MALGDGPRALVLDVARRARAAGAIVMFDPNYRPALWDGPEAAAAAMDPVLEHVDWYLCGSGEAESCSARATPAACRRLAARGVGGAVVRVGERGAWWPRAARSTRRAAAAEEVVDEIGAGDAFAAGFAYGLLQGWAPEACARAGERHRRAGRCAAPATGRPCRGWTRCANCFQANLGIEGATPMHRFRVARLVIAYGSDRHPVHALTASDHPPGSMGRGSKALSARAGTCT